ncbi:MAG: hypothetical protein LBU34_16045 [Planctomycetaceae bacterium]|jgi:hypothetical protein|nr:hypothetical protein [Planctomycetaceae bacterium]
MNNENIPKPSDILKLFDEFNKLSLSYKSDNDTGNIRLIGDAIEKLYSSPQHDTVQKILTQSLPEMHINTLMEWYSWMDTPKTSDELEITINILAILMQKTGWDGSSIIKEFPPFSSKGIYFDVGNVIADCLMAVAQTPKDVIECTKTYLYDENRYIILSALIHILSWLWGGESRIYDLSNFMPDLSVIFQEENDVAINIIVKDIKNILTLKVKNRNRSKSVC